MNIFVSLPDTAPSSRADSLFKLLFLRIFRASGTKAAA